MLIGVGGNGGTAPERERPGTSPNWGPTPNSLAPFSNMRVLVVLAIGRLRGPSPVTGTGDRWLNVYLRVAWCQLFSIMRGVIHGLS